MQTIAEKTGEETKFIQYRVRLEEDLRARFAVNRFPPRVSAQTVVKALWQQTTAPESRGILLLIMDLSRRAWSGSERARAFYEAQQHLWTELLMNYLPDSKAVEELLQLFQGAVLPYLITGDREVGLRTLERMVAKNSKESRRMSKDRKSLRKPRA